MTGLDRMPRARGWSLAPILLVIALGAGASACAAGDDGTEAEANLTPDTRLTFAAHDNFFEPARTEATAGAVEIVMNQAGANPHTFVFDGIGNAFLLEVTQSGDVGRGVIDLAPGTYTFFCDVPGHRADGMEGTLTVR